MLNRIKNKSTFLLITAIMLLSTEASSNMYNFQSPKEFAQSRYNRHLESFFRTRIKRILGHNGFVVHVYATLKSTAKKGKKVWIQNYRGKIISINEQITQLRSETSNSKKATHAKNKLSAPGFPLKKFQLPSLNEHNDFVLDSLSTDKTNSETLWRFNVFNHLAGSDKNNNPGIPADVIGGVGDRDMRRIPYKNLQGKNSLPGLENYTTAPWLATDRQRRQTQNSDKIRALQNIKKLYKQKINKSKNKKNVAFVVDNIKIDVLLDEDVSLEKEEFVSRFIVEKTQLIKNPNNILNITRARFDYKKYQDGYVPPQRIHVPRPQIIVQQPPPVKIIQQPPPVKIIKEQQNEKIKEQNIKKDKVDNSVNPDVPMPSWLRYWWIGLIVGLVFWFVLHRASVARAEEQHRRIKETIMLQNRSQTRFLN
jgi:hypothetical protein